MHNHLDRSELRELSHRQVAELILALERCARDRRRCIARRSEVLKVLAEAKDVLARELLGALGNWLTSNDSPSRRKDRASTHRLLQRWLLGLVRVWSRLDEARSGGPPLHFAVPVREQQELASELGLPLVSVSDLLQVQLQAWLRVRRSAGAKTQSVAKLQAFRARLLVLLAAWRQVDGSCRTPALLQLLPRLEHRGRIEVERKLLAAQNRVAKEAMVRLDSWSSEHPEDATCSEIRNAIHPGTHLGVLARRWDALGGHSLLTGNCETRLLALLSFAHDELGGGRVEVCSCSHDGCELEDRADPPNGVAAAGGASERVELVDLQVLLESGPDVYLAGVARRLCKNPRLPLQAAEVETDPAQAGSSLVTLRVRAVCASRSVTPDSRKRLPNISIPRSIEEPGARSVQIVKVITGNMIFSTLDTSRGGFIRIRRSSRVVSSFMMGGCMTGTRAM